MIPSNPDSPQLEHGYTRIANDLLGAILKYPFTGGELKVLLAVIRFTYGWNRKEALLKIREIAQVTHLSQRHVKRIIQQLNKKGILLKRSIGRVRLIFGLNKHFSTWKSWTEESGQECP